MRVQDVMCVSFWNKHDKKKVEQNESCMNMKGYISQYRKHRVFSIQHLSWNSCTKRISELLWTSFRSKCQQKGRPQGINKNLQSHLVSMCVWMSKANCSNIFRMCQTFRIVLESLILLASVKFYICDAETTEEPTTTITPNQTFTANQPYNMTLVVLEPVDGGWSFLLPKVLPVMDMAIGYVNQLYSGIVRFNLVYDKGSCERNVVGVSAARISCAHNISVFIGPGRFSLYFKQILFLLFCFLFL